VFVTPFKASHLQLALAFLQNSLGVYRLAWACRCASQQFLLTRPQIQLAQRADPVLLDVAGAMNALPDFASGQGDSAVSAAKGA